jgi:hypothetical protein
MKKLLPHEEGVIEQYAIEAIVKGYSLEELRSNLIKDNPKLNPQIFEGIIRKAHGKIKISTLVDVDKVIPIHIELYERIYKEFDELYFVPGKMKAMRLKEGIIGLHKESNKVEIYNELNIEIESDPTYDMTKLTKDEQKRLEGFFKRIV